MDNRIVDFQPVFTALSDITKFVHQNLNEFAQIVYLFFVGNGHNFLKF